MQPAPRCLLGGTFNPPHLGHVRCALEVASEIGVDRVHLMPCRLPPHKDTGGIAEQHRVNMVKLATQDEPALAPEWVELSLPEPSYTVKTLRHLRQQQARQPLIFVMGEDSWVSLTSWHEWPALLELANLVVMRRDTGAQKIPAELDKLAADHRIGDPTQLHRQTAGALYFARTRLQPVSSTRLRAALAEPVHDNDWLNTWLQPSVLNYIRENRLYV